MMTLVKNSKSILIKKTIRKFTTTDRLDHTNGNIIFFRLHLCLIRLKNPHSRTIDEILDLCLPLIHEKLLIDHNQESPF